MATIPKNERLLNLVSFLLKARRPVGIVEIKDSVDGYRGAGVSDASLDRRFERDKATLRELGVPLEYVGEDEPGGPGYLISRHTYFLPRIELDPAEVALLSAAGRFAVAGAAGPVSDALRSAVRKLRFDAPADGNIRGTAEERYVFHRRPLDKGDARRDVLGDLTSAVLARRTIGFRYYTIGRDRVARRKVEPYGIGFSDGHWYLVGRDLDREAIRVFRTDRIRGEIKRLRPNAAREEFEIPPDFRVQDHVGVPPWLFGESAKTAVRMRFDADVAFMVRLRPAPGDAWEEHDDGSATLTRQATHLESLLNWVLGFGHHVEVLDPPEFRARVRDALRDLAAAHRGKAKGGES